MLEVEGGYSSKRAEGLQSIYQFVELNKDFVLDQFTEYREKVKPIDILRLKLLNNQTRFKHELNLGILTPDQYQNKIEILNEKLKEQGGIKSSINNQFILNVFGGASIMPLPPEIIISYLQQVFV